MTTLVELVPEEESTISKDANDNISNHNCKNALRPKEKKIRPKCNRVLKRKLKKYKLRQDGKEDPDILEISDILESSLSLASPGEQKSSAELELDQIIPLNYLFKMGRKKQPCEKEKSVKSKKEVKVVNENGVVKLSPTIEEKKKTNAFKLLMDSRNKSLGSNSPGKDKPMDETEVQESNEKKNIKAKRNLVLQKMAESKGALKKKEIEEMQEEYINKKMKKRAEKLKSMILNKEPKAPKNTDGKSISKLQNGRSPLNSIKMEPNEKNQEKPVNKLQLVNMFSDTVEKGTPERKVISKEDEEFLNKLSPSIRKKESMLSYFKKVEKEQDITCTDTENDNVIKVKIITKLRKKSKKKNLSLNKDSTLQDLPLSDVETTLLYKKTEIVLGQTINEKHNKMKDISNEDRRKHKREIREHNIEDIVVSSNILDTKDDGRPRRSVKRPVKYNDDADLSSSDEELHIFAPKKKKQFDISQNKKEESIDLSSDNEEKPEKSEKQSKGTGKADIKKQSVKLAPIFSAKSQLDHAAIEAKQKFLQSGVPEQLKKMISKHVEKSITHNYFLKVVHVQQLDAQDSMPVPLSLTEYDLYIDVQKNAKSTEESFNNLLNMVTSQNASTLFTKHTINPQTVLQSLKEKYPRYPIYRSFRLLRGKKKGEYKVGTNYLDLDNSVEILNSSIDDQNVNPEQLSWSDKYKPLAASQIIGNFDSVKELRKWLVSWTENDMKSKVNTNGSDSSDYYQSDVDSKDSMKSSNNLLVLSGPVGSGKTSSVYAIAAELSIKVIEVNASSKRTGKIMLQDLQEATQSHKVNRGTGSNENSQKSQEVDEPPHITIPVKKRGRPKKNIEVVTPNKPVLKKLKSKETLDNGLTTSQEITRTCMSLILIDDADIVFEQDDGFCSAIVQLVHCSKRPVILITSSLSCPHLQRFIQSSKILKMNPLLPNILGTWLDIMCLADSGMCWPGVGSKVLNFFKGDIRKTINCLQFYVCSLEHALNQEVEGCSQNTEKVYVDDETSNMSWADRDTIEDRNSNDEAIELHDPSKSFILVQLHSMQHNLQADLFNIWWSVPKLLSISNTYTPEKLNEDFSKANKNKSDTIESISRVLDYISIGDFYSYRSHKNRVGNITSEPWFSQESNSVSELENFDRYNSHYGVSNEIAHDIARSSINIAQTELGCEVNFDLDYPGMTQQRQRDRIVSRHNNLTAYLSPQAVLDRKALALDYWSSCRTICRIEKCKTDTNSKRNNRFCHYLKSSSVLCKNDSFDKLANSLCPSENSEMLNRKEL